MASSEYMNLMSWKVVAQWSILHGLMTPAEKLVIWERFERDWAQFCTWIVETYPTESQAWAVANAEDARKEGEYQINGPQTFNTPNTCQGWTKAGDQCKKPFITNITAENFDTRRCNIHQYPYYSGK